MYSFEIFQSDLSKWHYKEYGESKLKEKYLSIASIVLNVAGQTIIFGLDGLSIVSQVAVSLIPERAKGMAVKLMMNVINPETKHLDKDRSYCIEIMRSEMELTREDILHILGEMKEGQIISRSDGMVAEQDKV